MCILFELDKTVCFLLLPNVWNFRFFNFKRTDTVTLSKYLYDLFAGSCLVRLVNSGFLLLLVEPYPLIILDRVVRV